MCALSTIMPAHKEVREAALDDCHSQRCSTAADLDPNNNDSESRATLSSQTGAALKEISRLAVAPTTTLNGSAQGTKEGAPISKPCDLQIGYVNNTMNLFLKYVRKIEYPDGRKEYDMSGILSRECYEEWTKTRRNTPSKIEYVFKDAVLSCFRGSDEKRMLPVEMQKALVELVRKRQIWPCFQGQHNSSGELIMIGKCGFRGKAHFEKKRQQSFIQKNLDTILRTIDMKTTTSIQKPVSVPPHPLSTKRTLKRFRQADIAPTNLQVATSRGGDTWKMNTSNYSYHSDYTDSDLAAFEFNSAPPMHHIYDGNVPADTSTSNLHEDQSLKRAKTVRRGSSGVLDSNVDLNEIADLIYPLC